MYHLDKLPITLRPVKEEDHAFLKRLYRSRRPDLAQLSAPPEMIEQLIAMQQHIQTIGYKNNYPNAQPSIIEVNHHAVGQIIFNEGAEQLHIIDIAILPEAQNKGYAKNTIHFLKQYAKERGCTITLNVQHHNFKAKQLYDTAGFRPIRSSEIESEMVWQPEIEHIHRTFA